MIDEFAKDANIEKETVLKLRNALRYSTDRTGFSWNDKQAVFNELPKNLRYQVAMAMHKGAAKYLSFFKKKDMVLISAVIPFLNPIFIKGGDLVYKLDEYADEIYFIVKGRVSLLYSTEEIILKALQRGAHFGDIETIQKIPRKYPVKAERDSELLILNKSILQLIMYEFPIIWDTMVHDAREKDETYEKCGIEIKLIRKLKINGEIDDLHPEELKKIIELKCTKYSLARQNSISKEPTMNDLMEILKEVKSKLINLEKTTAELQRALIDHHIPIPNTELAEQT